MHPAAKDVLSAIESQREELAELILQLANTYGPVGQELRTAQVVHDWYVEHGIESRVQPMIGERANTVARVRGTGEGPSLLFNAHLDTEASGPDYDRLMQVPDPNVIGARREGDRILGHTALNDRHAHALFMIAARAIARSGITTRGDLVLTSVAGETGQAPVDEYEGLQYEGKGFGSSYLVRHGVRADYAIVSETSDFALCWYHCGAAYYKLTLRGRNMYTPRMRRPDDGLRDHPNAIVKAAEVVRAFEEWAIGYTAEHTAETACGTVVPNAQIGAVRGGIPWRPNRSATYTALYADVRIPPGLQLNEVTRSLRGALGGLDVEVELDLIMYKAGAEGRGVEPLADAIRAAHRSVRDTDPPARAETAVVSMWRDSNVFNNAGIPAINFGPSRGTAHVQGHGYLDLDDLVDAAKMYALTSLLITGTLTREDLDLPGAG